MRKCYFCRQDTEYWSTIHGICHTCANQYDVKQVFTTYDVETVVGAHIYVDNWWIRMDLAQNYTEIRDHSTLMGAVLLVLPGFPITLDNVERKLPLYILFS